MSRLIARIAKMSACVSSPIQYELKNGGAATRRTKSATLLPAAIQPGWLDRDHDHHRREEREVRQLRHQRLPEVVDESDHETADEGALQTAHAADDDDHECEREQIEIHPGISAENRAAHPAAKRRERGARREDEARDAPDIDSRGRRHLGIV